MTNDTINGASIIARTKDAIYVRLPYVLQREIHGGCQCEHCKRDPHLAMWDTLVVPTGGKTKQRPNGQYAYTVHMPDASVPAFYAYIVRTKQEGK